VLAEIYGCSPRGSISPIMKEAKVLLEELGHIRQGRKRCLKFD